MFICVCLCVCLYVYKITKNNGSANMKIEHFDVGEVSSIFSIFSFYYSVFFSVRVLAAYSHSAADSPTSPKVLKHPPKS